MVAFPFAPAFADPIVTMPQIATGAPVAANDPMAQVKSGVTDVMEVFEVPSMPLKARRDKLRDLGAKYFDFNSMARSVMGYHWRELSPAQRDEFVTVFTRFIEDAYLSKLQDYSVKQVVDELPTVKIRFTLRDLRRPRLRSGLQHRHPEGTKGPDRPQLPHAFD